MREKNMVQDLVQSIGYCSVEYFAKRYQVSSRTISNDIKYIMQISKQYGFEVLLKRKEGYYLKVLDQDKLQQFLQAEDVHTPIKDRIVVVLMKLLLTPDYMTQDDLALALKVSKSMIKLDMNKVEERLLTKALTLDRKAHYGICIKGNVEVRKEFLLTLMEEHPFVEDYVDTFIHPHEMKQIDKLLVDELRANDLSTNYTEMIKLDRYLKITIACCKNGMIHEQVVEDNNTIYSTIAHYLKNGIKHICAILLSDKDVEDIANYIRQKTKLKTIRLEYDDDLKHEILAFLKQGDIDYKTSFLEDEEFIQSLFAHVSLLIDRLHQSISFDNPLVKEISAKYPEIFNISIKFTDMLEKHYKVVATQDEIGFIATHFAAHMEKEYRNKLRSFNKIAIVCSSGGGSAFLIKLKIESLFQDANVATFSFMEMSELHQFSPDIIFTIRALDESFSVPIVLIKELLNDEDIRKIKHMFEFCGVERKVSLPYDSFPTLFHKDAFHILDDGEYRTIIQDMAKDLEQRQYAEQGYMERVLQREDILSTVYMNGVAIPHPIEMCSDTNMLSIAILKHDVMVEEKNVKLIFMVNLTKGNLKLHQNISRVLFDVMNDKKLVDTIWKSLSFEDFMKNISKLDY